MKQWIFILTIFATTQIIAQPKPGKLAWQYQTNGKIVTTPYIYNNNVYYGSSDGNFYCNALSDGKLNWRYQSGGAIRSSASSGEGKIFFGCEDGNIYALDALKGTLEWKFLTK